MVRRSAGESRMKVVLTILAIGLVVIVLTLQWMRLEVDDFTTRCRVEGGAVQIFSSQMSGYKCVSPDGRIIAIEGPGL
jgi:hypothetical protein